MQKPSTCNQIGRDRALGRGGSLGFRAAALSEGGGAGSADRLTANRWLSSSAFWLFAAREGAYRL